MLNKFNRVPTQNSIKMENFNFKRLQKAIERSLSEIIEEQSQKYIDAFKEGLHEDKDNMVTLTVEQVGKLVKGAWTKGVADACDDIPREHEVYIDEYDGNFHYEGHLEVDISEVHVDPDFDPDWATQFVEDAVFGRVDEVRLEHKNSSESLENS